MTDSSDRSDRERLVRWFARAVEAVRGDTAMRNALRHIPTPAAAPAIIAVGKAAPEMATAALEWLAERGLRAPRGLVVSHRSGVAVPGMDCVQGDHPQPGDNSERASQALERFVESLAGPSPVWVLLSGGATALIASPRKGMPADWMRSEFEELGERGLDIHRLNAERRKLTRWGGGRLADALEGHEVLAWVISDVIGNDLTVIGSGPLMRDSDDTRVPHRIIADGATAVAAAIRAAHHDRVEAFAHDEAIVGEAKTAAQGLAAWIDAQQHSAVGDAVLHAWHSETTVTLPPSHGLGGRAQMFSLALARELAKLDNDVEATVLVAGTDGRDGPTDAAGAIVDRHTVARIQGTGVDVESCIARADSHRALDRAGCLLRTGATGANVADLVLVLLRHH
jgi:glycerate 2-kinase